MAGLHVAASGSLLEFALEELPSQGVGCISSLFMYPLSFTEFLKALGNESLLTVLEQAGVDVPVDEAFHRRLIDLFRTFQLIGGMPRVVREYVEKRFALPIEVKSGSSGKMRSMHMFLEERGLKRGIRMSLENFATYGSIETVPLYCAGRFHV